MFMGSRIASVAVALVLVSVLAGCSQATVPVQTDKAASNAVAPAQVTTTSGGGEGSTQKAPAKVGEQVTSGDWTLTVDKVSHASEAGGAKAVSAHELVVVEMTVARKGKDEGTGPSYFKLTDASGATIQAAPTSSPDFIFNMQRPVKADTPTKVKIAYQVPKGTTGLTLRFSPFNEAGPQPVEIALD
jgi:hypothetical protein